MAEVPEENGQKKRRKSPNTKINIITSNQLAKEYNITSREVWNITKKMSRTHIGFVQISAENFACDKASWQDAFASIIAKKIASAESKRKPV